MSVMSPQRSSVSARVAEMSPRELARITGICWIITFLTSIPAVLLYDPLLTTLTFKGFNMASPVFDGRRDTDGDANPALAGS